MVILSTGWRSNYIICGNANEMTEKRQIVRKKNKKKYAYRPSDKVVSKISAISSVLGIVGVAGYALLIAGSFQAAGKAGVLYGLAGWILLVMSVVGMYFAVKSFEDTAAMMIWKITGCVTNGLVLAFSAVIFLLGL